MMKLVITQVQQHMLWYDPLKHQEGCRILLLSWSFALHWAVWTASVPSWVKQPTTNFGGVSFLVECHAPTATVWYLNSQWSSSASSSPQPHLPTYVGALQSVWNHSHTGSCRWLDLKMLAALEHVWSEPVFDCSYLGRVCGNTIFADNMSQVLNWSSEQFTLMRLDFESCTLQLR